MSLANTVISDFGDPQELLVNRNTTPQQVVNGHNTPGDRVQLTFDAVIQPMRGQEILMFPESDRLRQSYKVYSTDILQLAQPKNKLLSDIVTYNEQAFEVVSVERWVMDDFVYYKSIIRRIDDK